MGVYLASGIGLLGQGPLSRLWGLARPASRLSSYPVMWLIQLPQAFGSATLRLGTPGFTAPTRHPRARRAGCLPASGVHPAIRAGPTRWQCPASIQRHACPAVLVQLVSIASRSAALGISHVSTRLPLAILQSEGIQRPSFSPSVTRSVGWCPARLGVVF